MEGQGEPASRPSFGPDGALTSHFPDAEVAQPHPEACRPRRPKESRMVSAMRCKVTREGVRREWTVDDPTASVSVFLPPQMQVPDAHWKGEDDGQ